tara:strand:- start:631 stop:1239 length:609 start_codon:yes stop_codon:yes gene_type:complete
MKTLIKSKKECLFLGTNKKTRLVKEIEKNNWKVICTKVSISKNLARSYDLIISYNYRHILKRDVLNNLKRPAINLHSSYLPYNRGSFPNFWSFIDNTLKGVTIHEIDEGIDTGPIICRKKIKFNIHNPKTNTFKKTYAILKNKVENLFIHNIDKILDQKYNTSKQNKNGTLHFRKELPKFMDNWNMNISEAIKKYKKITKKN